MLPDLSYHSPGVGADQTMSDLRSEIDEVSNGIRYGRSLCVILTFFSLHGPCHDAPELCSAMMVLPGETLMGCYKQYLWCQLALDTHLNTFEKNCSEHINL